eukprot:g10421.t1
MCDLAWVRTSILGKYGLVSSCEARAVIMVSTLGGYVGVLVACTFFGTSYVPTKKYPTYDGMIFQWFMCSGILSVGLIWGLASNDWLHVAQQGLYVFPEGLLGGGVWAVANMLIPQVVNNIGLGPGFMIWNGANLLCGYFVARFGLFGVAKSAADASFSNEFGMVCMFLSILVFGMIRPEQAAEYPREKEPLVASNNSTTQTSPSSRENTLPHIPLYDLGSSKSKHEDEHRLPGNRALGIFLALFAGALLGNSLTPYAKWHAQCKTRVAAGDEVKSTCKSLNFLFSQTIGIYIVSTAAFVVYSTFKKLAKRPMPRSVMRPAYLSGVLWGIALGGQLYAAGSLGYATAYPMTAIGPAVVSMLWSLLYFREIQGQRNLTLMLVASGLVVVGVLCQKPDVQTT